MDNHSQPQVLRYNTIPKDVRLLQLVCDRAEDRDEWEKTERNHPRKGSECACNGVLFDELEFLSGETPALHA